jgi:sortase (surface protein transpeptidase)
MTMFAIFILSGCNTSTSTQLVSPPISNSVVRKTATAKPEMTAPAKPEIAVTPTPAVVAHPVRLLIPAIGVDAFIEQLGVQASGDLATPTQNPWTDVGWYKMGPRPGEKGSAVIDGHLDRPGGYPAVFWYLRNMQVGNKVMVVMSNGKTINFRATQIAYYTPQAAPIQEIFGNNSGTYLNLITCAGDWIPSQHQTTLRLVVYTSLA